MTKTAVPDEVTKGSVERMKEKLRQWFSANFNASKAEKYNGWFAMIGIISGIGAYAITGQIIPGFF